MTLRLPQRPLVDVRREELLATSAGQRGPEFTWRTQHPLVGAAECPLTRIAAHHVDDPDAPDDASPREIIRQEPV